MLSQFKARAITLVILFVSFVPLSVAHSQGFEEVALLALVNDARISGAIAAAHREETRVEQRQATSNFQLSTTLSAAGTGQNTDITTRLAQVNLSKELWSFGRQATSVEAAQEQVNLAWIEVIRANQDVFAEVSLAYANVLEADELLIVRQSFVEELYERRRVLEERLQERLASITELQSLDGRIVEAEVAVYNAEEATITTRYELERLTGHYAGAVFKDELLAYVEFVPLNMEQALRFADVSSAESLVSEQRFRIAEVEIESRNRANRPTLEAYGTYQYGERSSLEINSGEIGVRLSVPLYQGGLRGAIEDEGELSLEQALRLRQQDRAQIRQAASSAWASMEIAYRALITRANGLVVQQERLEAIQNEANVGLITIDDLLDARADLVERRASFVRAKYDHIRAQLTVLRTVGLASPIGK